MAEHIEHWRPTASLEAIKKRAELLKQIRAFFYARDVLEVDTPALSPSGNTDPNIESFCTNYTGPSKSGQLYLHTSPEFAMKRLLAADSGAIYQLCKVFRNGEAGNYHNPEFTMLEWYRPEFDHHQLMTEMAELLDEVLGETEKPIRKITYKDAFIECAGVDPFVADALALANCAKKHGLEVVGMVDASIDAWCDLLMDQVVVPALGEGRVFIIDYPASQSSLAKISEQDPRIAERFELFIDGVEIANGFHELTDAAEQRQRFVDENNERKQAGLMPMPMDENLLQALASGIPSCAGVALGIDRLLMLLMNEKQLKRVMSFDISRA